ncbi:MarR family transcriptional regulator [Micromonospora sp. KC207]|uniref:MarR family transcriptional regulator n=1 Tax=Micromonospora sp. KC207 TaxID=2530377 RepID=UPI0010539B92|nr:MarR family transcriptional regulator [Micromonospora sp. KC207]TDC48461.1 MarR family transcriptional regulator [Micromonospora sp. KC207]
MEVREYRKEELAAQPIGWWSGETYRRVVGEIRAALAVERLTQPHWWTLNHVAGDPGRWGRATLAERLTPYDDLGTDVDGVFDDLVGRGWLTEEAGAFRLTEAGEAGRLRARDRTSRVHERVRAGITADEYAATIDVLRRIVANLGGDGNLP